MVVSWTNVFLYCYVASRFFLAAAGNVNTRVHEEELPHSQETTQGMEASESVDTTVPRESKGHSRICLCQNVASTPKYILRLLILGETAPVRGNEERGIQDHVSDKS